MIKDIGERTKAVEDLVDAVNSMGNASDINNVLNYLLEAQKHLTSIYKYDIEELYKEIYGGKYVD